MSKNQRASLSAERRVILVFLVSALAGIVLVGGALRYALQRDALAQCRTNLEGRASVLAAQCESEMAEARQDLEFLSKTPSFQQLPYVDQIDVSLNGVPENVDVEKRRLLTQLMNKAERFSVLYVLRPNADIYVLEPFRLQPKLAKHNLSDRPYYQEVVRTKAPVISDSFVGADGVLAVAILVPLLADSGEVTGYLGGVFYLNRLSQLVSKERVRPFDAGFIVDRKGQLIAHTDVELLKAGPREHFIEQHPLESSFLASVGGTAGAKPGEVLYGECASPGGAEHHLAAFVPLSSGWSLGLMRDRAAVLAEARPVIWGITSLAGLLLAVIGALGVAIAHGIGRRWDGAERALRVSEADLRTTLTSIGDGVITTDTDRRVTRLNDAAAVLTGWTTQDAVGLTLDEVFKIVNEDTRAPAPDPVARVLASGQIEGLANHSVLIARDGAECAIADSAAPIRDPAGDITGVVLVFRDVSDERRAARALRESERRFRSLAVATSQIIWSTDAQGQVCGPMPSFQAYTGQSDEEIHGSGWASTLHPDDVERTIKVWQEAVAAKTGYLTEYRLRRRDGIYRHFTARGAPVMTDDGRILEWIGTCSDITERKRAQEALNAQKQRLEMASAAGNVALWDWDIVSGVLEWSSAVDPMLGFGKEKFPRTIEAWGNVLHPDDAARVAEALNRHQRGEASYEIDYRVRRADGSYIWWHVIGVAERDAAGKAVRMTGSCADITERKRAEAALITSEERFRTAAESLTDVVYDWDIKEKVDWYGDIDGIMGYPPEGFPRTIKGWAATIHPEDKDRVMAALEGHVKGVAPYVAEYRVERRDGEWRWWSARGTALRNDRGEPYKMIGSITDITDRKRAEEEIRQLNTGLEQRVRERTAELEAANQELGAFSYSVSHDLRAPLRHVQGYVDMLAREVGGQLSEKGRRYMTTIADASREMGVLIDDLLAFSRMGHAEMIETSVNLDKLVQDTLRDLEPATRERNIVWKIPPLPAVQADPAMLKLVLINLLGNAVKFTRPREPAQIEMGSAGTEDGRVIFFVRDNGVGFDPQYAHKLFGVFQRLHRADEFEGTGIGLASVRRIIARHGGRTWAEGKLNEGATFYFTLKASK
jgi:PAS domain S-box-containing protein